MRKQFICPLCGDSLYYVLHVHAEKHDMTLKEFVKRFPRAAEYTVSSKKSWGRKKK